MLELLKKLKNSLLVQILFKKYKYFYLKKDTNFFEKCVSLKIAQNVKTRKVLNKSEQNFEHEPFVMF